MREAKSYQSLADEYEAHQDKLTQKNVEDRLFALQIVHEVDDVDLCDLRARDFGVDAEEAEELLAILGEIGSFKWHCEE